MSGFESPRGRLGVSLFSDPINHGHFTEATLYLCALLGLRANTLDLYAIQLKNQASFNNKPINKFQKAKRNIEAQKSASVTKKYNK